MAGPEPPDFDENPTAWPTRTGPWAFGVVIVVDTWITFCPLSAAVSFANFSTDKPLPGLLHSRRVRGSGGLDREADKGKVARA